MMTFFEKIGQYIVERQAEFDLIPDERRAELNEMAKLVATSQDTGTPVQLIFICTHNSRRSHLSQIWAQVAAYNYDVQNVETFSGGTEGTAFNPRAVAAVQKVGFAIKDNGPAENPRYAVHYADDAEPMICFSKTYDDEYNPQSDFVAIMTCSSADEACPVVLGAAARIAIRYEDPKAYDDTEQETGKYDERCRQIAREMLYAFSLV